MSDERDRPIDAVNDSPKNKAERHTSRRGFLKTAIASGLAVAVTAKVAKEATEALIKADNQRIYDADEIRAGQALRGKKLVLMSKAEKEELVKTFEAAK